MTFVLVIAAVLLVVLLEVVANRRKRRVFEARFPPITDEEFVELCGPKTNPDVALRVRRIVSNQLGIEYDRIHPSASFVNDLGMD